MTNKLSDIFSGISFYLLPTACCLLLYSCQTDIQTINQVTSTVNLPSETAKDAEIIYSDSGQVKMKLLAVQLDRYVDKNYIVFPKGVKIDFYDDSLNVSSKLKADYGIRYDKDEKMEVKRNVEVVNVKGEKLNTEHLIWDGKKHLIYTEAFVKITRGEEVSYGDGLESNEDFTRYHIKHFQGSFYLKDGQDSTAHQ